MKSFFVLFFASLSVVLATQNLSAEVAVGNCRPHLVSYSTISEAVLAVPPNSTVLICPGVYPEQVTINQPLTLEGLSDHLSSRVVITVPNGSVISPQVSVQGSDFGDFGPVKIINLIVDGSGSGFDCSSGGQFTGIEYDDASGSMDRVEVRNQNPGGCGFGIVLSSINGNEVNIRNSSIHDFDNTGVSAGGVAADLTLNLTSNWIESSSKSVQAGVDYDFSAVGLAVHNLIDVTGQFGLVLDNFFDGMTASENTITGSNVGIQAGCCGSKITGNILLNNGTGILIYSGATDEIVKANTIVQSGSAGIDADCSSRNIAENNIIFGAPVGIANVTSNDTVAPNLFYSVLTRTTACSF